MQRLIAVRLGMVHPVAQAVGVRLVYLAYRDIYPEAFVYLLGACLRGVYYAYGKNVVYLLKRDVFVLHLVPYGVRALHSCLYLVVDAHLVESLTYRSGELFEQCVA